MKERPSFPARLDLSNPLRPARAGLAKTASRPGAHLPMQAASADMRAIRHNMVQKLVAQGIGDKPVLHAMAMWSATAL